MPFVHENVKVELFPGTPSPIVYLSENDVGDTVVFELVYKGQPVNIPSGSVVKFKGTKKDGLGFTVDSSNVSGNVVSFVVSEDMTSCFGVVEAEISITLSNNKHGTCNVVLIVEKNPHSDGIQDGSYPQIISEMRELVEQIEGDAETASNAADTAVAAKNSALEIQQDVHQYTADSIDDWLDEHPEATTTVQDGSLTYKKLVTGTLGFVTPEMYGAKGDGVTDDSVAWTNAIETGKIVYATGTYLISSEVSNIQNVHIYGHNAVIVPIMESNMEKCCLKFTGCDDVKIENIEFTNPNSTSATVTAVRASAIFCDNCSSVKISGCKFENISLTQCRTPKLVNQRFGVGFTINDCNDVIIDSCSIIGTFQDEASYIYYSTKSIEDIRVTISNCEVIGATAFSAFNVFADQIQFVGIHSDKTCNNTMSLCNLIGNYIYVRDCVLEGTFLDKVDNSEVSWRKSKFVSVENTKFVCEAEDISNMTAVRILSEFSVIKNCSFINQKIRLHNTAPNESAVEAYPDAITTLTYNDVLKVSNSNFYYTTADSNRIACVSKYDINRVNDISIDNCTFDLNNVGSSAVDGRESGIHFINNIVRNGKNSAVSGSSFFPIVAINDTNPDARVYVKDNKIDKCASLMYLRGRIHTLEVVDYNNVQITLNGVKNASYYAELNISDDNHTHARINSVVYKGNDSHSVKYIQGPRTSFSQGEIVYNDSGAYIVTTGGCITDNEITAGSSVVGWGNYYLGTHAYKCLANGTLSTSIVEPEEYVVGNIYTIGGVDFLLVGNRGSFTSIATTSN